MFGDEDVDITLEQWLLAFGFSFFKYFRLDGVGDKFDKTCILAMAFAYIRLGKMGMSLA